MADNSDHEFEPATHVGSTDARSSTTTEMSPEVRRDSSLYFTLVIFKVEDKLFSVPRHGFMVPGTIFEAMFALPGEHKTGKGLEGSSDDNPILLPVEKKDFRGFLRVMYPYNAQDPLTTTDWLGALKLASMWGFTKIRQAAMQALETHVQGLSAEEAATLARTYRIEGWLRDAYCKLVAKEPLKLEDLRKVPGFDDATVAGIFYAKYRCGQRFGITYSNTYCGLCNKSSNGKPECHCQIRPTIDEAFGKEFMDMKYNLDNSDDVPLPGSCVASMKKKRKGKK